ncbi:zinc finger CCCH domain-containing protein ZFN-like isoform X2 [Amborella trichopoda]|nr:zinc finger CCCH domain-containing protein ZFN-like isoform X2 [Amborella trichopoda]XP_020517444.1 zinc finger CCCH domain-containing protein ZFN-like isoform X2 [Amborella trichopoda]|eukprot:XP_006829499.2 zinc finger CCCH domain-containing protein ZFN-like isoform X2 [Amborella trichopoda]
MPQNWQPHHQNAVSLSSPINHLQEALWNLRIQGHDSQERANTPYPERPGQPDCVYYLRTGMCGYGSNCRFNHPPDPRQVVLYRGELPERDGQPDCQYFLKTGTCKFGPTCKYHHPSDRHESGPVPLNVSGLPVRQGEKACAYYLRTGSCKFGVACKFNHPQPAALSPVLAVTGSSGYGSAGSSLSLPSGPPPYVGGLSAWTLPRGPYVSSPRLQGSPTYMPIILSPSQGMISSPQGWSSYPNPGSPLASSDGSNVVYMQSTEPASSGPMRMPSPFVHQLLPALQNGLFPERPDQPECQYYMKTGDCKFGASCKYHHPLERAMPLTNCALGPLGLPLRPGQPLCTFYSKYGICKFGPTCKFDHTVVAPLNYGFPNVSTPEMPPVYQLSRTTHTERPSSENSSPNASNHEQKRQRQILRPEPSEVDQLKASSDDVIPQ